MKVPVTLHLQQVLVLSGLGFLGFFGFGVFLVVLVLVYLAIVIGVKKYITVVLVWISLISDVELLFMYLFAIYKVLIFFGERFLKVFCLFFNWVVCFLLVL